MGPFVSICVVNQTDKAVILYIDFFCFTTLRCLALDSPILRKCLVQTFIESYIGSKHAVYKIALGTKTGKFNRG